MNGKEVVEAELRGIRGKEGFHCHVVVVVVVLGISKTLSWTREYTLRRGKGERVSIATWWWWWWWWGWGERVSIATLVVVGTTT